MDYKGKITSCIETAITSKWKFVKQTQYRIHENTDSGGDLTLKVQPVFQVPRAIWIVLSRVVVACRNTLRQNIIEWSSLTVIPIGNLHANVSLLPKNGM